MNSFSKLYLFIYFFDGGKVWNGYVLNLLMFDRIQLWSCIVLAFCVLGRFLITVSTSVLVISLYISISLWFSPGYMNLRMCSLTLDSLLYYWDILKFLLFSDCICQCFLAFFLNGSSYMFVNLFKEPALSLNLSYCLFSLYVIHFHSDLYFLLPHIWGFICFFSSSFSYVSCLD